MGVYQQGAPLAESFLRAGGIGRCLLLQGSGMSALAPCSAGIALRLSGGELGLLGLPAPSVAEGPALSSLTQMPLS